MNRVYAKFLWFFLPLIIFFQGCATSYSAANVRARVVDYQTKRPLANVNVVGHWTLAEDLLHGRSLTDIKTVEAVTDDDGWFELPAWTGQNVPANVSRSAYMTSNDPEILFFKSNYMFAVVRNERSNPTARVGGSFRKSDWEGKTIEMKRFEGTRQQYAENTAFIFSDFSYQKCVFKYIPRMLIALDEEARKLEKEGVHNSIPRLHDLEQSARNEGCESPMSFFDGSVK